ncbi:hypothetical protein [Salarchaeum japonicum]|uniref:hypothetical protein n=1 Tax=Salarchaeum japonicum TaxID=555573 RepID=UPI003C720845
MGLLAPNTGGGGPVTIEPAVPNATDASSSEDTTFETGSDTLGTTSLGTTTGTDDQDSSLVDTGSGDTDIQVEDTSDPDDSSPAGGSGFTGGAARFLDVDEETVDDAIDQTSEQAVGDVVEDVANEQIEHGADGVQPGGDTTPNVEHPDNESATGSESGALSNINFGDPRTIAAVAAVAGIALYAGGR